VAVDTTLLVMIKERTSWINSSSVYWWYSLAVHLTVYAKASCRYCFSVFFLFFFCWLTL